MTIPSPSSLHFRYGRSAVPESIYPDMDEFYADLGTSYSKAIRAFADAGCRYMQLDEVNFTYLCDPKLRQQVTDRGDDVEKLPHIYASVINAALAGAPADMALSMHLCRGNFQSTFVASGGYEPVAEVLFNEINIGAYFMEYDSDRAGGFEPLRFVPKGKIVVLGLVTSKSGDLESRDAIKRRIEEATKHIALDQLCLSPQCGFASTEEGNILTEEQQWAKLRMIVELSRGDLGPMTTNTATAAGQRTQAAVPRRPRRQPPAHGRAEGRARPARDRRDHRRAAQSGRRPRDQGADPKAGGTPASNRSPTANTAARPGRPISFNRSTAWNPTQGERQFRFQGAQPRPIRLRVKEKLGGFSGHPMIDHFRFVKDNTSRTAKMTIPSPSALHFRYGREGVPESLYPDMEDFYRDLGETYRKVVRAFADAGCRYLQLDEVNLAYLCDPKLREEISARGDDPDALARGYATMINAAMSDIPDDMTISMHLCRGNFKSTFVASGGYEPVAEMLFNTIKVHGYFMEYDSDRAGGFEPLRFLPKGKSRRARPRHLQDRRAGDQGRDSAAASTRRRSSRRSTNSACRRNAASPPARTAICWRRRSNGPNCAWSSNWLTRSGGL